MKPERILFAFGTRPEAIKLAPVIKAIQSRRDNFDVRICVTGQHREMLDQVLRLFEIVPDVDLDIMESNQRQTDVASRILSALSSWIENDPPDRIIVQGDTTSAVAASLVGYYHKIPVAHIEAGLRTGDRLAPWPEEINRHLISVIADMHFAPTENARQNLERENISADSIFVTGNTVIDALQQMVEKLESSSSLLSALQAKFLFLDPQRRLILVTGHRRENFGDGLEQVFSALRTIVRSNSNVEIIFPLHMNPNVREPAWRMLSDPSSPECRRIHLVEPLDYGSFVYLMNLCDLIISDSGGIQEEASSLGKPVLLTRDVTERPEAVDAGTVRLVGVDAECIVTEAAQILTDADVYRHMSQANNLYGDGQASLRIAELLEKTFRRKLT